MDQNLTSKSSITINASAEKVWDALVSPKAIQQYMFGAQVVSDWHEGSAIVWRGEWQGKPFEDKGKILQLKPGRTLQYSHFSPLSGMRCAGKLSHGDDNTGRFRSSKDPGDIDAEQKCV